MTRWLMLIISRLKVEESKMIIYRKIASASMWILIIMQLSFTSLEPFAKNNKDIDFALLIW